MIVRRVHRANDWRIGEHGWLKAGLWEAGFQWQDGTGQKAHGQDSAFRFNYGSEA